ncbi:MAG: prephenate dehydrogenase/arogenate dehydrogenase family protein [Betaproteobacteria bacterium]|jgi:prephenate dehydrogenase
MHFKKLALIGCGLIGGSFALALKRAQAIERVSGFSASLSTREKALSLHVIDESANSIQEAVQGADLVLVAVPVNAIEACLSNIRESLNDEALVMDVGSTKHQITLAAQRALKERLHCFVPAHPIAGKERHGVAHAEATLFDHHTTILTPTPQSDAHLVALAKQVWQTIGSTVSIMSPEEHDQALAAISHLPHLIAFAAVNAIAQQDQRDLFLSLAGPGFRDFSRIAASAPSVWVDIFLSNPNEVLDQLSMFKKAIANFEQALRSKDPQTIENLIESASTVRKDWTPTGSKR